LVLEINKTWKATNPKWNVECYSIGSFITTVPRMEVSNLSWQALHFSLETSALPIFDVLTKVALFWL